MEVRIFTSMKPQAETLFKKPGKKSATSMSQISPSPPLSD